MNSRTSRGAFLAFLIGAAMLLAPTRESLGRDHWSPPPRGGRLTMKFSPTLGMDVGLIVRIDGQFAGAITRGHVFNQYLPAGPHRLAVYRNGRLFDAWHGTLDVRSGQTYAFLVKYRVNEVFLERVPSRQLGPF